MRIAAGLVALGILAVGLWQARPVLVWHLTVAPEIERLGLSDRLHPSTETGLPAPDPGWPRLRVGRLDLRAPLAAEQLGRCGSCAQGCRLELEGGSGWLAIFNSGLPGHARAVATFAPSALDVSIWRRRAENWRTIHSLASRATGSTPPLEAFRFDTPTSLGIVTRVESRDTERFVVYVFGPDGGPGGVLAVSRAGLPIVRRILGGLAVGDAIGSAYCDAGGDA